MMIDRLALTLFLAASLSSGVALAEDLSPTTLAQRYEHGDGVPKDEARALALYCAAAESGDIEGAFHLGWMYLLGRGVERDPASAGVWLAKAAAAGHSQAQALVERFRLSADGPAARCGKTEEPSRSAGPVRPLVAPKVVAGMVEEMAPRYGLDPRLVLAVIQVESAFRADAVSPKNALGLMQVLPATAERFNVSNPMEARANLTAGMKYLRWLLSYFRGDVTLSVAAYNAGEGRVVAHRGIPPYPETQEYVRRIQTYYPVNRHPFDPAVTAQTGGAWGNGVATPRS